MDFDDDDNMTLPDSDPSVHSDFSGTSSIGQCSMLCVCVLNIFKSMNSDLWLF